MRKVRSFNAKCKNCGKDFFAKPFLLEKGWGKYCSRACQYQSFRIGTLVNCAYCGKKCYKSPARLKRQLKSKNYFCSISCHCAWKNKRRKRENARKNRKNFWRSWCNSSIRTCGVLGAGAEPVDLPRRKNKKPAALFLKRPPKKILYDFYFRKNYSQTQIAELFGATHASVRRWFLYYKIAIKPRTLSCGRNPKTLENLELGKTEESQRKSAKSRTIYSQEKVIKKIREFVANEGRMPTKNEFNKNHFYPNRDTCQKLFGSWNNAIIAAGYTPNEQWFSPQGLVARDGHLCDSTSEVIIDDWLFKNNILHEREKLYPEGRYSCDFFIDNIFVEFFGLVNVSTVMDKYQKTMRKKRVMCKKYGIALIELYGKDLNNLKHSLGEKLEDIKDRGVLSKFISTGVHKL